MTVSAVGLLVPDFSLPATGGGTFTLSSQRGHPLVLYFYPRDSTSGCTLEAQQFRDLHGEFASLGCTIFGISRDSIRSHENFKGAQCLPFDLLVDANETACRLFDVIRMKNMYGKQVLGIQRSTFLIGRDGRLAREWRGVKADGHAAEVLAALRSL
jgi:thioredoxin-dependent peroxiredoxin